MDSVLPFPLLLVSLLLCLLSLILFKTKTDHSKASPSSPPGPWPLPFIGNLHHIIGSLPHHAMRDLSRKYGPLMLLRLGEIPTIIVSSPDAAREIMKIHDITFAARPVSTTLGIFTYGGKGTAFSSYGEYWRQLRKMYFLELLSTKQVQSYRSIREEEVGNLIKYLLSCASHCQLVDLSTRLSAMMNDISARAIFGSKCKNQDVFLRELDVSLKLGAGFNLADLFPSSRLGRFVSTAVKEAERCQQAKNHFLDGVIEQRRERKASTGEGEVEGLLGLLLRIYDEGAQTNPLDMETIKAVINELFGAGTETSSTTIEWAMSELLRNPRELKKAQSEIRQLLKGRPNVTESDTVKLDYLHLVIKETLRLHPPVPLLLPRQCREACHVLGYNVPEGMRVLVNVWAIGRDPKYWEDPEEFKPERFLDSSIDFKGSDFKFLPFGSGRRICPGISFGLANVELPLASLLYHFDWKLPDGLKQEEIDMSESFGITVRRKIPLLLHAVPHASDIAGHMHGNSITPDLLLEKSFG